MPLQDSFPKPAFVVINVAVNPVEDGKGRLTGYNLVAQGKTNNEQQIVGHYGTEVSREFIGSQAAILKDELSLH